MRAISVLLVVTVVAVALGCGDDDDTGSGGAGGTAGSGGSAGNADGSVGTGGTSGTGGTGGGGTGLEDGGIDSSFDPSTVDLTLGGFNQDLPDPSVNCIDSDIPIPYGCISVSGIVNGETFDLFCDDALSQSGAGGYGLSCYDTVDWDVSVAFWDEDFWDKDVLPSIFETTVVTEPQQWGWILFTWRETQASFDPPNLEKAIIAGWALRRTSASYSNFEIEAMGTFAASWSAFDPATCIDCLEGRIRGTFHGVYP